MSRNIEEVLKLVDLNIKNKKYEEALKYLNKIINAGPPNKHLLSMRANLHFELGYKNKLIEDMAAIFELDVNFKDFKDNPILYIYIGDYLFDHGKVNGNCLLSRMAYEKYLSVIDKDRSDFIDEKIIKVNKKIYSW